MSRVINVLYFKKSKDYNVFNIDVNRSIFVYNNDIKCDKTYFKRFVEKCFRNKRRLKS